MRNVLIISPRFPPINAADMHRVRHSLPHFHEMGWKATVLAVDPSRVDDYRDELLLRTVPSVADVRHVSALPSQWTRTLGIGNVVFRSLPFYLWAGSRVITQQDIDLVYFSTTAFPVLVLGRYWKRRHGVPYIIDMQDPWVAGHHWDEPAGERPLKARLVHQLGQWMEPVAMKGTDAIISVSRGYCDALQERYENIRPENCSVIPFGASQVDFDVLEDSHVENPFFRPSSDTINIVQVGRAGPDMETAAQGVFSALARGLDARPSLYRQVQMYFIGTRYSPPGQGTKTVEPIAQAYGVGDYVTEQTTRVPYFQALKVLRDADMLILLGSEDPKYTASKLYPYIMARNPLLAVFHEQSSVVDIMWETQVGPVVTFGSQGCDPETIGRRVEQEWGAMLERVPYEPDVDWDAFEPYTAETMTRRQVEVFDRVLES